MSLFQKTSIILPLAIFLSLSGEGWASTTKLVNSVQVDSAVLERKASIFVTMSNSTESILSMASSQATQLDTENSSPLMRALEAHAKSTQAPAVSVLKQLGVAYKSFWISNEIYIKDGSPSVVSAFLDALPRDSGIVSEIREEIVVPIMATFNSTEGEKTLAAGNSWGVDELRAPTVWDTVGAKGQNVIVGVIDSGKSPHADLQGKLVPGGWLDALTGRTKTFDDSGQGTHVTGTILGNNGIGVAPKARLTSCRACDAEGCPQNALLECAQFVHTKNARIVSCSWGISAKAIAKPFFDPAIDFWRRVNIIPVFPAGSDGNKCNTLAYPGENNKVIAVGATGKQSTIADFSSRGPSTRYPIKGGTKPDVSAPGVAIRSASHRDPAAHTDLSGSTLAVPHVTGLLALILSKKPDLTFEEAFAILKRTADRNVRTTIPQTCGGTSLTAVPNNIFGYGAIRADTAFEDASLREVDMKEENNQN